MSLVSRAITSGDGLTVDTNTKLSQSEATAMWAAGVRTIIRYVFFLAARAGDIDLGELTMLLAIGFTVVLVQHPRESKYNVLSDTTGHADAAWATKNALDAGYDPRRLPADAKKIRLALDMEGVKNPGANSFAHARAWVVDVLAAGFAVIVYIGFDPGLTSAQCDELVALGAQVQGCTEDDVEFWLDASGMPTGSPHDVRPLPSKGYALHQHPTSNLAGVEVDRNTVMKDGVLFGLGSGDVNVEEIDPHDMPTRPSLIPPPAMRRIPLPFEADTEPPPPPDDEDDKS